MKKHYVVSIVYRKKEIDKTTTDTLVSGTIQATSAREALGRAKRIKTDIGDPVLESSIPCVGGIECHFLSMLEIHEK